MTEAVHRLSQIATTVLLALAANTSFGGLPVLAKLLATDYYLPHVFALITDTETAHWRERALRNNRGYAQDVPMT